MREKQQSSKIDTQETDPNFERALEEYIDGVVAVEKENYRPSLRPFAAHEQEIRKDLSDVEIGQSQGLGADTASIGKEMLKEINKRVEEQTQLDLAVDEIQNISPPKIELSELDAEHMQDVDTEVQAKIQEEIERKIRESGLGHP